MNERQELEELRRLDELERKSLAGKGPSAIDMANDAVNLGLTYYQGRTLGLGPKVMSAIGSVPAKAALEGYEAIDNLSGGDYEAPSTKDLYKMGVRGYQGKVKDAYENNPVLAPVTEATGGIKSGLDFAKTKTSQGLNRWINAPQAKSGSLTEKALQAVNRAGRRFAAGEAGYRAYKVGTADPDKEAQELVSGVPVGGIFSGGLGFVGDSARAIAPQVDDGLRVAAEFAKKHNIPLSVDQVTDSRAFKNVQKISQELPFSGVEKFRDQQMAAFNRALTKTFGQDSDKITPELMNKAFKELGKKFDDFGRGKTFNIKIFDDAVDEILEDSDAYSEEAIKAFKKQADVIRGQAKQGFVKGERLSHQRGRINNLSRKANDFDKQTLFKDLENAVIETMTQGDDVAKAAIADTKHKYKNLITIEPLTQKSKGGNISPTLLANRVSRIYGRRYTVGEAGDIGELARVGKELLPELGGSDTAQKLMYYTGAGVGGIVEPTTTIGALGANKAYQSWFNQNQKMIDSMIKNEFLKQITAQNPSASAAITNSIMESLK